MNLHVNYGPPTYKHYTGHQASARRCRLCRRHTVHELVLVVPIGPNYYGPHEVWECRCRRTEYGPLDFLAINLLDVALMMRERGGL